MIQFKELSMEDVEGFWALLNTLDRETDYMMYEPEERAQCMNVQQLRAHLQRSVIDGTDFLQVAADDDQIVGYLWAERGKLRRISHTAYIVVGVLQDYSGKGIGTTFFQHLDRWARAHGIRRLELTVECRNQAARHLYEKCGFQTEGIREKSMLVEGTLVDEYYMAKIL